MPSSAGNNDCAFGLVEVVGTERERSVTDAFVSIANSLIDGYDIVDLYSTLTRYCADVLDVSAAGLLLADRSGVLQVAGASSESARNLEFFALQSKEGPCLECFTSGSPVTSEDLRLDAGRWPQFVPAALAAGVASVHALPMVLRGTVLGTVGLFGPAPGRLNHTDMMLGQAFAHVASVALVAGRASADKTVTNDQLQTALTSRIVLEQAKGVVAQVGDLDMESAFAVLRRYSRDHNQRLSEIAEAVVSRTLGPGPIIEHARIKGVIVRGSRDGRPAG